MHNAYRQETRKTSRCRLAVSAVHSRSFANSMSIQRGCSTPHCKSPNRLLVAFFLSSSITRGDVPRSKRQRVDGTDGEVILLFWTVILACLNVHRLLLLKSNTTISKTTRFLMAFYSRCKIGNDISRGNWARLGRRAVERRIREELQMYGMRSGSF